MELALAFHPDLQPIGEGLWKKNGEEKFIKES
jgi:hypothetical protein